MVASLALAWEVRVSPMAFQSPSLRGSGRFHRVCLVLGRASGVFQSPSLRGSGRFVGTGDPVLNGVKFQSPSLRGSGRFATIIAPGAGGAGHVSIPFIAGQWSLRSGDHRRAAGPGAVSIPFIAGQWSLPGRTTMTTVILAGFNPLHCGAVVASFAFLQLLAEPLVSIPFIAGQWSLHGS